MIRINLRLRCEHCGKRVKKLVKCSEDDCGLFVCAVCVVNSDFGALCPEHALMTPPEKLIEQYYEDKEADRCESY